MSTADQPAATGAAAEPMLRVVKGDPTDEELAALVCVLTARSSAPAAGRPAPVERRWGAYWRNLRAPLAPGPNSWAGSGRFV